MLISAAQYIFWICLALIVYVYAGYPLLLALGLFGGRKPVRRSPHFPKLSVLIPAFDEEKVIASKLKNVLASDYPSQLLEILVGDDASSDRTSAIVRACTAENVRLISSPHRLGKSSMQNKLVSRASGSLLVFTDADCFFPPAALRLLVENFADPTVGLVTNCPSFSNPGENCVIQAEGFYWRYEHWLRRQESDRDLLAVASGSLFAMRRELWIPLDPHSGDDFVLPLRVSLRGYRNVLEPRISAVTELTEKRPSSMLRMKMRIISKDLRGLLNHLSVLNPSRTGFLALALLSHKLLRWLVPYFLLALLMSNILLLHHSPYALGFFLQALFYTLAVVGFLGRGRHFRFPFSVAFSFCLVNGAALLGTLHCTCGRTAGTWRTVR